MEYRGVNVARRFFVRFRKDEDLLNGIYEVIRREGIKSGSVYLIGGLKKVSYGLYLGGEYKRMEKEGGFELLPSHGNITEKDGEPFVHLHISVADCNEGGRVWGGHAMEGCIVFPLAEVMIEEFDTTIPRVFEPDINLWAVKA
jgi:predicted DNA-binding protein with PD1-like motif